MLLTQTVRLKQNNVEKDILTNLCHLSKNLFNVGLYMVRQYFFQEQKYLSYESNYHLCKENENYQLLATDCGQQTLKYVDRCFKVFFKLLSMRKEGTYQERVNLPRYLAKDGYFPLIIPIRKRHDFAKDDWKFKIPTSRKYTRENGSVYITVPPNLREYRIKEIRILPKQKGKFLDAAFVYESNDQPVNVDKSSAISIDLGLNNLATVISTTNESFIIDGLWLKSKNQWFNKRRAKLVHHKDKQSIKHLTKQEAWLSYRRKNQVNDYLNKSAKYIIDFCLNRKIGTIIVGYNPTLKQNSNMGKRNNQNFVNIPIFTLRVKLESLCERYGLNYVEQEESYTSRASAIDKDDIPVYNADNPSKRKFSGVRVKRGLYKSKDGHLINADCNGSLNIGFKSKHEGFSRVSRVCLTQPVRVNVLRESPVIASA
ncbi:RNA-guided endonuclease TnpB family protein [Pleurocapsa sp. PCC 7319]|uniref:RNA-guided endonuclease InsQ/TnpB family protein n=1 Tax=Pleurocapsa sp. PCC 7319 TaxID=118161 RepID=UPI000372C5C5|nr:RNA-guided endonuclease TnpB family protein [Pleurocapsa sp. PCC 7319]